MFSVSHWHLFTKIFQGKPWILISNESSFSLMANLYHRQKDSWSLDYDERYLVESPFNRKEMAHSTCKITMADTILMGDIAGFFPMISAFFFHKGRTKMCESPLFAYQPHILQARNRYRIWFSWLFIPRCIFFCQVTMFIHTLKVLGSDFMAFTVKSTHLQMTSNAHSYYQISAQ